MRPLLIAAAGLSALALAACQQAGTPEEGAAAVEDGAIAPADLPPPEAIPEEEPVPEDMAPPMVEEPVMPSEPDRPTGSTPPTLPEDQPSTSER